MGEHSVEITFDDTQYEQLAALACSSGRSVADLLKDSICAQLDSAVPDVCPSPATVHPHDFPHSQWQCATSTENTQRALESLNRLLALCCEIERSHGTLPSSGLSDLRTLRDEELLP